MRPYRFLALVFAGVVLVGSSFAQTPVQDKIRAGAQTGAENLRTANYAKIVDSMYPPLIEMAGGHDKALADVQQTMAKVTQAGFKIDALDIGACSEVVPGGDKIFATVMQTVHMTNPKVKVEQSSYLLAVSADQGKTWYYLDGTALTPDLLKQLFPGFPSALKLPERQQPKVTPAT